jgi:hypothetical protein
MSDRQYVYGFQSADPTSPKLGVPAPSAIIKMVVQRLGAASPAKKANLIRRRARLYAREKR